MIHQKEEIDNEFVCNTEKSDENARENTDEYII